MILVENTPPWIAYYIYNDAMKLIPVARPLAWFPLRPFQKEEQAFKTWKEERRRGV